MCLYSSVFKVVGTTVGGSNRTFFINTYIIFKERLGWVCVMLKLKLHPISWGFKRVGLVLQEIQMDELY